MCAAKLVVVESQIQTMRKGKKRIREQHYADNTDGVVKKCTPQIGCVDTTWRDFTSCDPNNPSKKVCEPFRGTISVIKGACVRTVMATFSPQCILHADEFVSRQNTEIFRYFAGERLKAARKLIGNNAYNTFRTIGTPIKCTSQTGCEQDGCDCAPDSSNLKCLVSSDGYHINNNGFVHECTPQEGCEVNENTCIIRNPTKKKCSRVKAGYYVDAYDRVQKCTSQAGCKRDGNVWRSFRQNDVSGRRKRQVSHKTAFFDDGALVVEHVVKRRFF